MLFVVRVLGTHRLSDVRANRARWGGCGPCALVTAHGAFCGQCSKYDDDGGSSGGGGGGGGDGDDGNKKSSKDHRDRPR